MENLEFESVNNFKVGLSSVNNSTNSNSTRKSTVSVPDVTTVKSCEEAYEGSTTSAISSYMWGGTILFSFVVWIVCIVSLILNCVRKNTGKAVFSGIGIIIPIIAMVISSFGKGLIEIESDSEGLGMVLCILAIILELVFAIIAFVFCFSKNKNKEN